MAQLVARFLHTEEVVGSSPASPTEKTPVHAGVFFMPPHRPARRIRLRAGTRQFPGRGDCPGWCEVHHVTLWQQNAPTNIYNGTLLCWYHQHQHQH